MGFLCNRTKWFIKTRQLEEQTEQSREDQSLTDVKEVVNSADRTDTVQQESQGNGRKSIGTNTGKQIEQGSI